MIPATAALATPFTDWIRWFTAHRGGPRDVLQISADNARKWHAVGGC